MEFKKELGCKRCGKPAAYEGALYCGSACCVMFEDKVPYPYLQKEIDEYNQIKEKKGED